VKLDRSHRTQSDQERQSAIGTGERPDLEHRLRGWDVMDSELHENGDEDDAE